MEFTFSYILGVYSEFTVILGVLRVFLRVYFEFILSLLVKSHCFKLAENSKLYYYYYKWFTEVKQGVSVVTFFRLQRQRQSMVHDG